VVIESSKMNYILLLVLLIVCIIDIKTKKIPDLITITGMITGLIYNHFALNSILGILVGVLSVHCLNTAKIQKLGGGDAKLMGMLGAFWGWPVIFISLLSLFLFIPCKMYKIVKEKQGVYAYSPFIGLATLILFLYAR